MPVLRRNTTRTTETTLVLSSVDVITLRSRCVQCGNTKGYIEERNGQNCVFCASCRHFAYNAPKTETGQKPQSIASVHKGISPSRRHRIIERATARCEFCGNATHLHISHILSVTDGLALGLTESELNADDNLALLCDYCNLGMGKNSFNPRLYVALLKRRLNG